MSAQNIAFLNTTGVDVSVTGASASTALPFSSSLIMIKNVGAGEAFVKGGTSSAVTVAASAASGMSIPAGEIGVYRSDEIFTYIATIGLAATVLRVYPTEGI